jgi:hypothetical protein
MKKILGVVVLGLLLSTSAFSASKAGKGELTLTENTVNTFIQYIKGKGRKNPAWFYVTLDGTNYMYWFCASGNCAMRSDASSNCEIRTGQECKLFATRRTIKWKNDINPGKGKASTIKSKWSEAEIRAKLTELGFLGDSSYTPTTTTSKITKKVEKKKEPKKVVKKYELKGERSIALSWEGYEDLIAGTVKFDETDYRGTLNIPLPNNDGTCDGTYSLQEDGKGTWQIACSNNMGAAGTLKWVKDGGVTGNGTDHNDKKVKFTVSKNS